MRTFRQAALINQPMCHGLSIHFAAGGLWDLMITPDHRVNASGEDIGRSPSEYLHSAERFSFVSVEINHAASETVLSDCRSMKLLCRSREAASLLYRRSKDLLSSNHVSWSGGLEL